MAEIIRNSASLISSNNVRNDVNYINSIIYLSFSNKLIEKSLPFIFQEYIPMSRTFKNFDGKVVTKATFPDKFSIVCVSYGDKAMLEDTLISVYIMPEKFNHNYKTIYGNENNFYDNYLYRIEYDPKSDFISIFKRVPISIHLWDRETLFQEVPKRIF